MREIIFEELKIGDEVVTRDGNKGRIICVDLKDNSYPIAVAVTDEEKEGIQTNTKEGRFSISRKSSFDIFLSPKKEYVGLYRRSNGGYYTEDYKSKEDAENCISMDCIQLIEVEV